MSRHGLVGSSIKTIISQSHVRYPVRSAISRTTDHVFTRHSQLSCCLRLQRFSCVARNAARQQRSPSFIPPTPEDLGPPRRAREYPRLRRSMRWILWATAFGGVVYVVDDRFYASALTRTLRSLTTALIVALDYKLNFRDDPWFEGSISEVHQRNAERMISVLTTNGGLYVKIGQAIATQSAILPPAFAKRLTTFFDNASQNDWKDVERVFREDFGCSAEELFGEGAIIEKKARASASIAQVHWARLPDDREVAIKVQKTEIAKQIHFDLWTFKIIMRVYSYWFDLPLYNFVPYVADRLMLEADFENERKNAEDMAAKVQSSAFRDKVHIPTLYRELSSKRILTMEWIEGCPLYDKERISAPWQGGRGEGSPGANGVPLTYALPNAMGNSLKPDRTQWQGPDGKGGLGLSLKSVAELVVDLFSAQIFNWGLVHCDPHWGNIILRRQKSGKPELVLIDHGLYVRLEPELKQQYCTFWKCMMSFDMAGIRDVTAQWGVQAPDLFASATMMRPYEGGDGSTKARILGQFQGQTPAERQYAMQQAMRQGIRDVLADQEKFPRELFFVGRNMRIVQTINQHLGSPCNRIRIMGLCASRGLVEDPNLSFRQRVVFQGRHALFRVFLLGSDIAWWVSHIKQRLGWGGGLEDEIEKQMQFIAKDQLGMDLQHGVFEG